MVTSHPAPECKREVNYRCSVLARAWRDMVQRDQVQGAEEGFDLMWQSLTEE